MGLFVAWSAWQHPLAVTTPRLPLPEVPDFTAMATPLGPLEPSAVEARAQPTRNRLDHPRAGDCLVRIVGHGDTLPAAVVAILDGASGAPLSRRTLDSTGLPMAVRFQDIPAGEHWAVLARNDQELRFAYLDRARLAQHTPTTGQRTALLRGQVHELQVHLDKADESSICHGVPVLLRRPEDPDWRYRVPSDTADEDSAWLLISGKDGTIRFRQLGAGRYLLLVDGFERSAGMVDAPEWMPVTMDGDRILRLTGSAR